MTFAFTLLVADLSTSQICNHPFCFEQVERSIDPTGSNNDALYRVAGKFEILDRILPKLFITGHRVLMFFQMTVSSQIVAGLVCARADPRNFCRLS